MAFQDNTPWQAHGSPPLDERGAVAVVEAPDGEATEECAQTVCDHRPHGAENESHAGGIVLCKTIMPSQRSQAFLHDPHAAQQDSGGQNSVGVLVKHRVLQVVIVQCDKGREADQTERQHGMEPTRAKVRESSVEHEACCVDHAELVHELRGVWTEGSVVI